MVEKKSRDKNKNDRPICKQREYDLLLEQVRSPVNKGRDMNGNDNNDGQSTVIMNIVQELLATVHYFSDGNGINGLIGIQFESRRYT